MNAEYKALPRDVRALFPFATFRRYPDRCYAVVIGRRRGPCGNSRRTAFARFMRSGLIACSRSDS